MFNAAAIFNPSDGTSKRFSIPVVQELASQQLQSLPERYIRAENERPNALTLPHLNIPIIDMNIFLGDSDLCRQRELKKLGMACQEWGFFQDVNHLIPLSLTKRMKGIVREFIQLPLKEKLKYKMQEIEGYGQAFVISDGQVLDWADMMALTTLPPENRKVDFWPTKTVDFRETVNQYALEIQKLGKRAFRLLTVLLQDDEIVGLQICKDGEWFPGALVINIGDMLEVLSNGMYKSIEHRAVTNMDRDRISIAMFYGPDKETEVGPAPELIDELHPCQYRRFIQAEYIQHVFSGKLDGKKSIEFAKI